MYMIAIQGIMKESCSRYVIIFLDIRMWEEDIASKDKNFWEIWVLKAS